MTGRSKPLKSRLDKWLASKKPSDAISSNSEGRSGDHQLPLSFGQLRLWLLQQMNPNSPFYIYAESYQINGDLQLERFIESFKQVVSRHDILRTTFPSEDGKPWQKIHSQLEPEVLVKHLNAPNNITSKEESDTFLNTEAQRPFDLLNGPLVRLVIIQLDKHQYRAAVVMHHIITDKWSMNILREEWCTLYQGNTLPPLDIQYTDFAIDQRGQQLEDKHLQFWKDKLAGDLPVMELPSSKPRIGSPNFEGAFSQKEFSSQVSEQISTLTNELQITRFTFFLTVFNILLSKYSGSLDLLVATPVTNRDRTQLEKVIGFFNETIILRSVLSEEMTFGEALNQVKTTVLEAFANKNVPFESLVRSLRPERLFGSNPLFQVMFLYHKVPPHPMLDDRISWEYSTMDLGVAKFDLTLYISENDGQFTSIIEYATDRFDESTIEKMHGHLKTLIGAILTNQKSTISNLPILQPNERHQIITEWNDNASELPTESIVDLISRTASNSPDKPAVLYQGNTLSYQSLQSNANTVVHELHKIGIGPGHTVGIATNRSPEMVIAIFGVLCSGAAYVPLDVDYPMARLNHMAKDADVSVILTTSQHEDLFRDLETELLYVDQMSDESTPSVILPKIESNDLAYIIYTSGSSGDPKGVPVNHGNLISSTSARFSFYPTDPERFLLLSSFSFDSSVAGIFWTLSKGGALVIPEENMEQDVLELGNLISRTKVTHTLLLPSLYGLLLEHVPEDKLGSLNTVIVAGEACNASICKSHFEHLEGVNLYNEYGPSEATVWSTVHHIQPEDIVNPVPIGRPIQNTQIFILDHSLQPVPAGVIGDFHIAGPGVVEGYLNNPELTSKKFIESPFDTEDRPLYKTGDLARYRADGVIEYLGRSDQQVKIRGYRIETAEIQNVIERYPGINESVVVIHDSGSQNGADQADANDLAQLNHLLDEMNPAEVDYLLASIESIDQFGMVDIENKNGDD